MSEEAYKNLRTKVFDSIRGLRMACGRATTRDALLKQVVETLVELENAVMNGK